MSAEKGKDNYPKFVFLFVFVTWVMEMEWNLSTQEHSYEIRNMNVYLLNNLTTCKKHIVSFCIVFVVTSSISPEELLYIFEFVMHWQTYYSNNKRVLVEVLRKKKLEKYFFPKF